MTDTNTPTAPPAVPAAGSLLEVSCDRRFKAQRPCPYCGGEITCTAGGWDQEDDGTWVATSVDIECSNEPPIDSKRWDEWDSEHGGTDWNEQWHRLHESLIRGLKRRYRFKMENNPALPAGGALPTHDHD